MSVLEELLELEQAGWRALCEGTGHVFYADLMTDSGLMVLANGVVMDRDEVVASLAAAPRWLRFDLVDEQLASTADGAALVYQASAWRSEDEPPFVAIMTSVYTRQHDRWRLALYQQTPVTD